MRIQEYIHQVSSIIAGIITVVVMIISDMIHGVGYILMAIIGNIHQISLKHASETSTIA